jgi:hypothetical protein
MKTRRPIWLWAFALCVLGLGSAGVWRGAVLWRSRAILFERGSSLSPAALGLFCLLFVLCGGALFASAVGLWFRRPWAIAATRALVPSYALVAQVYLWLWVRSGLMWERRWISTIGALLGAGLSVGALSWSTSRRWLGLG